MSSPVPFASIVVVNWNGLIHLDPCLQSLLVLDYPADRFEVIVVDNASTDGSIAHLRQNYPSVQVIHNDHNVGFAPAVNQAAEAAVGDVVVLVNNDMRVDVLWLREMVRHYDPSNGVVCVGGAIFDWEGETLDFGGGAINFHGFGDQPGVGTPTGEVDLADGSIQPFACGGSMLVQRDLFVELGGFDPKFFAYFEDVDFGLRLQVCGYSTKLAANARSFHRHHGTSSRFQWHERMVLLDRNSLRMLIKNVGDEALAPLLAGAMLMQSERALFDAQSDRKQFDVGAGFDDTVMVNRLALSRMHANHDVLTDLGPLLELRRAIQQRRRVPDSEVFRTFRLPLEPMGNSDPDYARTFRQVAGFLGIDSFFSESPVRRVVVLCHDLIGERMAGTAIRAWELACSLAQHASVTIASDRPIGRTHLGVEPLHIDGESGHMALRDSIEAADVVVLFGFDVTRYPYLGNCRALRVVDLYDPWIFGSLEQYDSMTTAQAEGSKNHEIATLNQLMDIGDMFICASERQRDFWFGMLASRGRLDKRAHDLDPQLRKLIDVVAFGVPQRNALPAKPGLGLRDGKYPSIHADSLVVLWGGGTWDWFDPLALVKAFETLSPEFPQARLFFMGLELEGRGIPEMSMTAQLQSYLHQTGLVADGRVVLGPWVPYDERGGVLRDADIGTVIAKNMAENRLAFRTRMLDHFWAGLPTLATGGDVLAELIAEAGAGLVVPANDQLALIDALRSLLSDADLRHRQAAVALSLADRFRWNDVVAPIVQLIHQPAPYRAARKQL